MSFCRTSLNRASQVIKKRAFNSSSHSLRANTATIFRRISQRTFSDKKVSHTNPNPNQNHKLIVGMAVSGLIAGGLLYQNSKEEKKRRDDIKQRVLGFEEKLQLQTKSEATFEERLNIIEQQLLIIEKCKTAIEKELKVETVSENQELVFSEELSSVEKRLILIEGRLRNISDFPCYRYQHGKIEAKTMDCEIDIDNFNNGLSITIKTPRLILSSLTEAEYNNYYTLYNDIEVMKTFHDGKPKCRQLVKERYLDYWQRDLGNKNLFSAFAVYEKESGAFVGSVAADHRGDDPGEAELAYLVMKNLWRKRYGQEAANAILNNFIPFAVLVGCDPNIRGKHFTKVVATSRIDNDGSKGILEKFMHPVPNGITEKYGALRQEYSISKEELVARLLLKQPVISKTTAKFTQVKNNDILPDLTPRVAQR
jgi:RimJ/RimL family protein N-acetyltransferase